MKHRILPAHRVHPLHRFHVLFIIFIVFFFVMLLILVMLSRLHPSAITGNAEQAASRVNITQTPLSHCEAILDPGTRMVGFPCLPYETSREELFANLSLKGASVGAIYRYNPLRVARWDVYNGSLPPYVVQTMDRFTRFNGLYITMLGTETYSYDGLLPHPTTDYLYGGWNLVSFAANDSEPLPAAIGSIAGVLTQVETLETTQEQGNYLIYANPGGGSLENLSPNLAYWMFLSSDGQWVIS